MANLREVRTRIASVKSTRQITSAMKMVSASKLRKAQNAINELRYYSKNLKEILNELDKTVSISQNHKYIASKEGNKALLLICSSNKGLCGPYNTHILKKATTHINSLKEANYEVALYIIGKKAHDFFKKRNDEILHYDLEINENATFENAREISNEFKDYFAENKFARIDAVYNQFKNAVVQEPLAETLLPVNISGNEIPENEKSDNKQDINDELHIDPDFEHIKHILEPSSENIIDFIVPEVIDVEVFRILLDSYASEQGARMTSMHQATENANEIIQELTTTYNKVRQASITKELVEIVSCAEALK